MHLCGPLCKRLITEEALGEKYNIWLISDKMIWRKVTLTSALQLAGARGKYRSVDNNSMVIYKPAFWFSETKPECV